MSLAFSMVWANIFRTFQMQVVRLVGLDEASFVLSEGSVVIPALNCAITGVVQHQPILQKSVDHACH